MSITKENITITSEKGFIYNVMLEHKPHFGFTTAIYNDSIIGQVELGRITEPLSDDDREWEMYHERFDEWTDEIKTNIISICIKYFNNTELS